MTCPIYRALFSWAAIPLQDAYMSALVEEVRAGKSLPDPMTAKRIRVLAGISQQRLADELGVSRVTVARWEDGGRHPRSMNKKKYSDLLNQLREVLA